MLVFELHHLSFVILSSFVLRHSSLPGIRGGRVATRGLTRYCNSMAVNCDFLIVGGGVMGTSIAWHLAKRRAGRVVLLEKSYLGAGSSGKSGAIVRQHYSNRLTASMAQRSMRVYEQFDAVVGGPGVFTRTGMVLIVNEKDKPGLDANVKMQQELGIDVRP